MGTPGVIFAEGLDVAPLRFISEPLNAISEQYVRSRSGGVAYLVHVGGSLSGRSLRRLLLELTDLERTKGREAVRLPIDD